MNALAKQTGLILRNDLRLLWRDARTGKLQLFSNLILIGILFVLFNGSTILIFSAFGRPPLVGETVAWFFFGFLMLGAAMNNAVAVLFERADFDLLLSSPVSARAILLARLTAMIVGAALSVALFIVPLINGVAIGVSWHYASGYLVWLLLATAVASAGVWLTLALVRWLGARRARIWSQVIAALLGALVYLAFQGQNLLPREMRGVAATKLAHALQNPALTFVARAARGEWVPLLILVAIAGGLAVVTTRLLALLFVTGIQESGGIKPKARRHRRHRFVDGLVRATFWKDVRLIVRDPLLLSKVLPSVLYLIPAVFSLGQFGHGGAPAMLATFAVFCCAVLSSQLTAVAASGEEGWDMIRLSPSSTATLRIAKIGAGMALPVALSGAISIVITGLGRPGLALFSLVTAVIGSAASCWIEVAAMQPTPRKDLIQRGGRRAKYMSGGRLLAGLVFIGVGTTAVALAANGLWLWSMLAFGIVVLTALGCFALVEMQDIEFEAPSTARHDQPTPV
jgi:ABC-2 type transport system permease protein